MNIFEYPFDTEELLARKRKIKRKLLEGLPADAMKRKIAVLGGSTTNEVVDQLELFLLNYGIRAEFYQSEYAQYWQDAMFGNPELDNFHPDIIYIHTNWRNINRFPSIKSTEDEIREILDEEYSRYESMWLNLIKKFHCPVIQNNFERPNYRLLGNSDISDSHGRSSFIQRMNAKLYEFANRHKGFYINDLEYLAADYGITAWNDTRFWNLYKYAMPPDAVPSVAHSVSTIIKSIYGKNKKVLVLDLDNTLWGGVVGDDGVEKIEIGPEIPTGQIYAEFQDYCKRLKEIGVILAVNSKNDEENAFAGLGHPDGILRREDFVSIKANWESKTSNMFALSEELTLGTDSFVFVDDNPAERSIVERQVDGVSVIDADVVDDFIKSIDHSGYFEMTTFSEEDLDKTVLYHAKAQAKKLQAAFADYDEYLRSLEMRAQITGFKAGYIPRIAQLTNKTNQFNLTTLRCSEDDIRHMADNGNYICLCGRLVDKFADNGIVSVVAGEQAGLRLHVRLWLMSCRVLKRDMEKVMMNVLVQEARKKGITEIVGYYFPTAKNKMVEDFYGQFGYQLLENKENGEKIWRLSTDCYKEKDVNIGLESIKRL